MDEEYHSLMVNDTWDLVTLPKGRKIVRCKWVYKTKYASDGSVERLKARLVAKGLSQVEGIDYNETFAPVSKMNSIRLVLPFQHYVTRKSINWMSSLPFYMVIYRRKFTWNNLLDMFRITLSLSISLRNPYMALSKILELVCQNR